MNIWFSKTIYFKCISRLITNSDDVRKLFDNFNQLLCGSLNIYLKYNPEFSLLKITKENNKLTHRINKINLFVYN